MIPMRRLGRLSDPEMRDRAALLLDAVGLGSKLHRPSRHLSGGEQQRVAIARALANDPRVILADEPTGNLDSENSKIVLDMFSELNEKFNQTIIMITHNPEAAENCHRIIKMRDGLVVED